jgi:hypothetical protein
VADRQTEFDAWLSERFGSEGEFTALIVLVSIGESAVELLRSTFLHVIGDEVRWAELAAMFGSSGVTWDGVAIVEARAEDGGLVPDAEARERLADLVGRLNEDRLVLNEGMFFDRLGRRLEIAEETTH